MDFGKYTFLIFTILTLISCEKDDEGNKSAPVRPLAEVAAENQRDIENYLNTHFYNYEEFENPPQNFDFKIKINPIEGENASKKPLMRDVKEVTINISDDDETNIPHKLYTLNIRDGAGKNRATIADSVYLRYTGQLLKGTEFDKATTPIWLDLVGSLRGFREGLPGFKDGGAIVTKDDGTFEVKNYGIGLIIMPSGLGYFSRATANIPAYSPLIFKIELLRVNQADHDGDGIPSFMEDINKDGLFSNDNTDGDQIPDYSDSDDDGDGTPTRREIIIHSNGRITFPDKDKDGVPDYRDSDTR